jgi:hypothetical protein
VNVASRADARVGDRDAKKSRQRLTAKRCLRGVWRFVGDYIHGLPKFAAGDRARLSLETSWDHNPQDLHAIVRVLPAEANVGQYRVRPGTGSQ